MSFEGMNLTLLLISIAAPVGAFDVLYFHIYRYRLASRPESLAETFTHVLRGAIFGAVALTLTLYEPRGLWFWLVGGLFVLDFVNSLVDAFLERNARSAFGGLTRLEYVLHVAGATFMGAIALAFLVRGAPAASLATELASRQLAVPPPMAIGGYLTALGALVLAAYEAAVLATACPCRRLFLQPRSA
jgi:hypothetical protein